MSDRFSKIVSVALWSTSSSMLLAADAVNTTPDDVELAPITVSATSLDPLSTYVAPAETKGALKNDISLMETSQAVSVISEGLIRDQGATKVEEAIRNSSGVAIGGNYDGWDYFRIRGFEAGGSNIFIDGLRRGDHGKSDEMYGLEKVEVLKGPASTLYGQASLGGAVNLVSKKPKREFGGEIGTTIGSFDLFKAFLDINVPLVTPYAAAPSEMSSGKDGKEVQPTTIASDSGFGAYGRVVGLFSQGGSFVDHEDRERWFVAPSLTLEWDDTTTLTFLGSYLYDSGNFAMPLPAEGTVLPNPYGDLPIDRWVGTSTGNARMDFRRYRIGYEFKHEFNEMFSFRQNFLYSRTNQTWGDSLYPSFLDADKRTLWMYAYHYEEELDRIGVDSAFDVKFDTGPVHHTLTLGFDYYWTDSRSKSGQINYADFPNAYVGLDLYRPNYDQEIPRDYNFTGSETSTQSFGLYLQNHMKLGEKLALTLGARADRSEYETGLLSDNKSGVTPRAGLTYEVVPGLALYGNYSRSFTPQWYSLDEAGVPVDPEEGENLEAGIKFNAFDGRWTGMMSVYQLTRENVATSNPASPSPYDSIVSGEQESKGFEFETAAQITDGLSLIASYTYVDAEVTEDNTIAVGTPLQGVPEHVANIWLKYSFQDGWLKGFGVGVGARYYSHQSGDTHHTFDLPEYVRVDAALFYERENFRAQVNFNNVTDERYFSGSYNNVYVLPGAPFNVSASVAWKF